MRSSPLCEPFACRTRTIMFRRRISVKRRVRAVLLCIPTRSVGTREKAISRRGSCPCPVGTTDDSPPFQRWVREQTSLPVPQGRLQRVSPYVIAREYKQPRQSRVPKRLRPARLPRSLRLPRNDGLSPSVAPCEKTTNPHAPTKKNANPSSAAWPLFGTISKS